MLSAGTSLVLAQISEDFFVPIRRRDDQHIPMVLRGGADHAWAADVYVFDRLVEGDVGLLDRLFERVEVDANEVDWLDAVGFHGSGVFGVVAEREQAAVDS